MNINKNISVWRGNNTPPTKYHFWIKEDGSQFVQNKYGNWVEIYISKSDTDSIKIESINPTNDTILASYELYVNNEKRGVTIDIPKDQTIKDIKMSTIDATIDNNGNIVDGDGSLALCISYTIANGTYKIVHIDYSKFIEENEFSDGLQVTNHNVKIKIDPTSSQYLTVSPEGIKLSGIEEDISNLAESDLALQGNIDAEATARITADADLLAKINKEITDRTAADNAEATVRANADNHLQNQLDNIIPLSVLEVNTAFNEVFYPPTDGEHEW